MSPDKKGIIHLLSSGRNQLLVLLALVFISYGNTLLNSYSIDDHFVILDNNYVQKGIAGIPDILTHHYITIGDEKVDYRPMTQIIMAIEYQIFGKNPHVSHFINLVIYALLIALIFKICNTVFSKNKEWRWFSFLVALIFTVHPAHTEVVASIKNREEILSVLFALLTLLYSWKYFNHETNGSKGLILPLVFLLLSFFSKVSSMYIIGVIILLGFFHGLNKSRKYRFYLLSILLFAVSVTYFLILWNAASRTVVFTENPLVIGVGLSERLGTSALTMWYYLKFMFVPWPFGFYYGYNMIPVSPVYDPLALLSIVVHLALLVIGFRLFRKKKLSGFFILAYFGSILLYSNLLVFYTGIVAERALFLPGLWLIAFVVLLVLEWLQSKKREKLSGLLSIPLTLLVIAAMALTIHRNTQWKDQLTLMSSDIEHLKNSAPANYMYAYALDGEANRSDSPEVKDSLYRKALKHYHRTLAITDDSPDALFHIGMIHEYYYGHADSSAYYFKKALDLDSSEHLAQFQLARNYYLQNRLEESDSLFADLYKKQPNDSLTLYFYSQVLFLQGEVAKAEGTAEKLITLYPNDYYGYMTLGVLYEREGNMEKAIPYLEKATELGGRDEYVYNAMTRYYLATGRVDLFDALKRKYESGGR